MTTVFGIRHPEINLGILVADRQTTSIDNGTRMPVGKHLGRKLWKSKDNNYSFGNIGNFDNETRDFAQKLVEGDIDVQKIISKGYFPELRKINIKRMGKKIPNPQLTNSIVLVTRFDNNPKLYTCFPLGEVAERVWTCAGSGEQKIIEYMDAVNVISEAKDYLGEGPLVEGTDLIRFGLEAVRRAQSQDIYSHGLDLMVCTPDKIVDHYASLGDDFGKKLGKIQRKHIIKSK